MFGSHLVCLQTHSFNVFCMKAAGAQKDELKAQPVPGVCRDTVCWCVCRVVWERGIWVFCEDPPVSKMPALPLQSRQSLALEDNFTPLKVDVSLCKLDASWLQSMCLHCCFRLDHE